MLSLNDLSLDYDNITLVSRYISSIESRDNVDTSIELFPGLMLNIPIIASPMVDVINADVAIKLRKLGGFAFLHRFQTIEDQAREFGDVEKNDVECGCAVGLDEWERLEYLYERDCRYFILDVANGANERVHSFMIDVKQFYKEAMFIVGNVVSGDQYKWCSNLPNVYGVRVGVAGGKACTTKNTTGIYQGAASLLQDCVKRGCKAKIIADGGIRGPDDLCKSIALGGHAVILGSVIANCRESPAELSTKDGSAYKVYHGSASYDNQLRYKEKPRYIEGKTVLLEHKNESLLDLINRFSEGLRSSMSYFNANNLSEYYNNTEWKIIL